MSACVPGSTLDQTILFSPGAVELLEGERLDEVVISFVDDAGLAIDVGASRSGLNAGDVYTLASALSSPVDAGYGPGLDIEGPGIVPLAILVDVPGSTFATLDVQEVAVVIDGHRIERGESDDAVDRLLTIASDCSDA